MVALLTGFAAPVLALAEAVEPIEALDVRAAHMAGRHRAEDVKGLGDACMIRAYC